MYKKFNDLLDILTGRNRVKKIVIIISGILFFIVWYYFIMWFAGTVVYLGTDQTHSRMWYGINEYHRFALLLYVLSTGVILFSIFRNGKLNQTAYKDERGVFFMEKGTHGTAHFATREEKLEYFFLKNIEDTDQLIIGIDEETGKIISFKFKDYGATGTKNVLLIASSGSGKSVSFVLPNLLQLPLRAKPESVVCVDPAGELYLRTGQYFRNNDYDVKLFNLKNLDYSEHWNCLQECISETTERIDINRLQSFALIFMKNSATAKDQDVWFEVAQNLIEACIGLVGYKRDINIINNYKEIYEQIVGELNDNTSSFNKILDNKYAPFPWAEEQIRYVARKTNVDMDELEKLFINIKESAPKFTINEVYKIINNIEDTKIIDEFTKIPNFYPAKRAWARFSEKKAGLKDGAINGAQFKFKIFDDDRLRNLVSKDGINFKTINLKKSAYFIAVSDTDETLKPIASLFFSFFYKDAQENYDNEEQLAAKEKRENRCLPVMAMLDEFPSLGVITGSEKLFGSIMSDSRKREIYQCLVVQDYTQLEGTYGRFVKNDIISACQTQLYMGGNDLDTQEYISKKTGIATVMSDSHKEVSNPLGHNTTLLTNEMSVGSTDRNLTNIDEAGKVVDEILVMRQWCSPFYCKPFFWKEHPAYLNDECPKVSYYENVAYSGDPYLAPDFDFETMQTYQEKINETKEDKQKASHDAIEKINSKYTIDDLLPQLGIELNKPKYNSKQTKNKESKENKDTEVTRNSIKDIMQGKKPTYDKRSNNSELDE